MLRISKEIGRMPAAKSSSGTSGGQAVDPRGDSLSSLPAVNITVWEVAGLVLIIWTALFLRFGRWDLLEFKEDESIAMQLALGFVSEGHLPLAGLMSSVGVANPPLFIYLLIPVVALSTNLAVITSFIAATGTVAVVVCWHVGRKYYSPAVGLAAAAFFAVSPWAVIYARKIWAQDFVPIFAALTLWALHALILNGNRRVIFWVVLLPLCVIQIHFSGFALMAAVGCILLLLRPKFDWRFAVAGAVVAFVVFTPFLYYQMKTNWADFRQAATALRGDPQANPEGRLIDPVSGFPLPSHHYLTHALGIVNGGEIEDLLGLAKPKFEEGLTFENWALWFQQFVCVLGLVYLLFLGVRNIRWSKTFPWAAVEQNEAKTAWILVCWVLVPVLIYFVVRLGTFLSYFVLFYPVPYLLCAVVGHKLWMMAGTVVPARLRIPARALLGGALGFFLAGNLFFIMNLYGFVARHGGAFGSYGTILGFKEEAAIYLAKNVDVRKMLVEKRLGQMDHYGVVGPPEPDILILAALSEIVPKQSAFLPNDRVMIVDCNRADFTAEQWAQLAATPKREFGPIQLYIIMSPEAK